MLYYLLFGKLAFQAEAKLQILNGDFVLPPSRPPPLCALVRELLVVQPSGRPTIQTLLAKLDALTLSLGLDPSLTAPAAAPSPATEPEPAGVSPQPGAQLCPVLPFQQCLSNRDGGHLSCFIGPAAPEPRSRQASTPPPGRGSSFRMASQSLPPQRASSGM